MDVAVEDGVTGQPMPFYLIALRPGKHGLEVEFGTTRPTAETMSAQVRDIVVTSNSPWRPPNNEPAVILLTSAD